MLEKDAPRPAFALNPTVEDVPIALSIYFNELVYGLKRRQHDIITLSLGEAFFDIPMFPFDEGDILKGYHYCDSQGIPELRQRIASIYERLYGAVVDPDKEIMVTAGSKVAIYMALKCILEPGGEVLVHEPAWLSYQEQVKLCGGNVRFIPFDCPIENFGDYFTDKTRCLILNNPNNPSGRVYTHDELNFLCNLTESRGSYFLMDEAYSDFVDKESFLSLAHQVKRHPGIIVVNSLSKNMGMSGWRIGYVISNNKIIQNIVKLNQHLITCAPSLLQYYMARYFDRLLDITLPQIKEVISKRARIAKVMDKMGLSYLPGSSTFYFFINVYFFRNEVNFSIDFLFVDAVRKSFVIFPVVRL